MPGNRLLVPVSDSGGIRQTVEYAVSRALADGSGSIRLVVVESGQSTAGQFLPGALDADDGSTEQFLDRTAVWAREDAGDQAGNLTVETSRIGMDRYLFSPGDVAVALAAEANAHDIDRIVLDPEYDPGIGAPFLRPLEAELARFDFDIEEAPISRRTRRGPLLVRTTPVQAASLFFLSFLFYQVLAGVFTPFDLVTGAVSATIVAAALSQVTFSRNPGFSSLLQIVRLTIYVPYLLWEILRANVAVAAVILDPRVSIEPRMTRIDPAVWGAIPITTLANSITLTPGTLTVRVDGEDLVVHTLVAGAREDLFDGGLERGVRFVFYGRKAMTIPSPRERKDTEILQQPDGDGSEPDADPAAEGDP